MISKPAKWPAAPITRSARCRRAWRRNWKRVAPDVVVVTLQLPANEALAYRAGQYIEFMLRDGKRRSYSMASRAVEPGVSR